MIKHSPVRFLLVLCVVWACKWAVDALFYTKPDAAAVQRDVRVPMALPNVWSAKPIIRDQYT
jgi:hypothetical protein